MKVQDIHSASLATSTAIYECFVNSFIKPLEVIRVLNAAGVRFMLIGAYAIGGWTKAPRATQDVDILVAARGQKKAITALLTAFPLLVREDHEVVVRLRHQETGQVAVDVVKPIEPLMKEALKYGQMVQAGKQTYQIPSLELALAMKFAAMISLSRNDEKRLLDDYDFIRMVKSNPEIDPEKLVLLGELVYHGGGAEITELVRRVRAGEKLEL